ncbi:hypothetical protein [Kitasatospora sp. SUK 42]|uniref:hypothetical protein n=1 Tax=Kitasatospora sp. SUK 42 TaxID=1588882 RepID=UPI0018C9DD84|nr:hypothetical protein [Kitasatospora sp. SUK 42]MBV2153673.1 hypothetical protein [Kitasatospora sp. SUK 42]
MLNPMSNPELVQDKQFSEALEGAAAVKVAERGWSRLKIPGESLHLNLTTSDFEAGAPGEALPLDREQPGQV